MPSITVGDSIGLAINRTGDMLFRPFRLNRWLAIGVGAALTMVGNGGGFSSFNSFRSSSPAKPGAAGGFDFSKITAWIQAHLLPLLLATLIVVLLLSALYLVSRWLNSRGQFMFLDNIVNNTDRVKAPWADFRELGNSLFKFRIGWDLIVFNVYLLLLGIALLIAGHDLYHALVVQRFEFTASIGAAVLFLVIAVIVAALILTLFRFIVFDLAVPVMYIRRMHAWAAVKVTWRELFLPHIGVCLLFCLMLLVVAMARAFWLIFAVFAFSCFTLCIGYFALLLPIIGNYPLAVLSLPILTFEQAYKLHFISQFGNDYRIHWQYGAGAGFPVILNAPPVPDFPPPPLPGV